MKQYLLLTSAFVAGGLLSGTAGAACIQTPSCSSLGYESTSACEGGLKCPFGNAWNCTGPNNTTEIKNIKNEITNIKNRITKLENNSGSGTGSGSGTSSLCDSCNVGDFICGGKCYAPGIVLTESGGLPSDCTYYVSQKENGVCTRITTGYGPARTLTAQEWTKDADFGENRDSSYYRLLKLLCFASDEDDSVIKNMYVPVSIDVRSFSGSFLGIYLSTTQGCYPSDIETGSYFVACDVNDLKTCFGNTNMSFRVPVESTF